MESIGSSVGKDGINKYQDVCVIQTLLNNNISQLAPFPPLDVDGDCGDKTIDLICEFQQRIVRIQSPDGRVDPNGKTLQMLNNNATSPLPSDSEDPSFISLDLCFPFAYRPQQSYKTGMRRFGANRKGNRKHAGADLYAPVGTAIYAMDDGEVINGPYAFYLGTQAVEIEHTNFVARYGEIRGVESGIQKGSKIKKGQLIASVGELRGLDMSMLHLELYKGTATGSLTLRGNKPYHRRNDLIDPTPVLDRAQCR